MVQYRFPNQCDRRFQNQMPVNLEPVTLWRCEVDNRPGALASVLAPLAGAGLDLRVLFSYHYPGVAARGEVEVFPITSEKLTDAARAAGLFPSSLPTLLAEGYNRP